MDGDPFGLYGVRRRNGDVRPAAARSEGGEQQEQGREPHGRPNGDGPT